MCTSTLANRKAVSRIARAKIACSMCSLYATRRVRARGPSTIAPDRIDGTLDGRLLAESDLIGAPGLDGHVAVALLRALEAGRRGRPAEVAVDALAIDVPAP